VSCPSRDEARPSGSAFSAVAQVAPVTVFYAAEAYHQDYYTLNPNQPYIVFHDKPKVEALQKDFPKLWTATKAKS
jgi:peptide-methionine (S)-S-oxide reductase